MSQVYFGWVPSAVQFPEDLDLPQFSLIRTFQEDCSTNYTTGIEMPPESSRIRAIYSSKSRHYTMPPLAMPLCCY